MSFTETVIFMGMIKIPHFLPQIHILHSILELQDRGKLASGKVEKFLSSCYLQKQSYLWA